jgi:hypothetical protein
MAGPPINTIINAMADASEMKGGTAKKKKKLIPGSAAEEAADKAKGIVETPAQERSEMRKK